MIKVFHNDAAYLFSYKPFLVLPNQICLENHPSQHFSKVLLVFLKNCYGSKIAFFPRKTITHLLIYTNTLAVSFAIGGDANWRRRFNPSQRATNALPHRCTRILFKSASIHLLLWSICFLFGAVAQVVLFPSFLLSFHFPSSIFLFLLFFPLLCVSFSLCAGLYGCIILGPPVRNGGHGAAMLSLCAQCSNSEKNEIVVL